VAASSDATGSIAEGGNWLLEYRRGEIESKTVFNVSVSSELDGLLASIDVTTLSQTGPGSIEAAIAFANSNPGTTIVFRVAGNINITSALPAINKSTTIDGTLAPGYSGTPVVFLNGEFGLSHDGLRFVSGASNSLVQGIGIINFNGDGIEIQSSNGFRILDNYIGTNGTTDQSNTRNGIRVSNSDLLIIQHDFE